MVKVAINEQEVNWPHLADVQAKAISVGDDGTLWIINNNDEP